MSSQVLEVAADLLPDNMHDALDVLRSMDSAALQSAQDYFQAAERRWNNANFRTRLSAYKAIAEFDRTGTVTGSASSPAEATIELNELLAQVLRFDTARALLAKYTARWPTAKQLTKQAIMLGPSGMAVDDFRNQANNDVQVVGKPGATATFMVFCGLRHQFGINLNVLHHCWLAKYPANAVYVRDYSESLYLAGIQSLGDDDETISKLQQLLEKLGTQNLICLGNSAGVFGALYYGVRLNARHVLCYAGPSSIEIGLGFPAKQAYKRINELRAQNRIRCPDMRDLYKQHPETKARMFFAAEHVPDQMQAQNMAGLPNVSLEAVAGVKDHFVVDLLVQQGVFQESLASAVFG